MDREFTEIRNEADTVRLRDLISYYCVEGSEEFLELLSAIDTEGIISMDQTDLNQRLIKLLCMNQFIARFKRELERLTICRDRLMGQTTSMA